jgi:hypothetical protein
LSKTTVIRKAVSDGITAQRFEAKYLISESLALAVRDFIAPYVLRDPNLVSGDHYLLTSQYFDGEGLPLYHSSVNGEKNRKKLRIREYGVNRPESVFFETKRRSGQIVSKDRFRLAESDSAAFLNGEDGGVLSMPDKDRAAALKFLDLRDALRATPRILVRYAREPYMSALDEPVRITFDRHLCCSPSREYREDVWNWKREWYTPNLTGVILEVKFTNAFPWWVRRLVSRFELEKISICKYVYCVDALAQNGIFVKNSSLRAAGRNS